MNAPITALVIILNKDAVADIEVELDFGRDARRAMETENIARASTR